jgi:ribosomal protein S18 acetylase RimI-like enzyme
VEVSYEAVAEGELAAVVTYLEMRSPPEHQIPQSPLSLRRVDVPQPEHYRDLFRLIGAPWLWFSRLVIDDAHLASIIQHPRVELYSVLDEAGREVGIIELDFREHGECELSFIGLIPELSGKGHGRWLLAEAVHRAWREGVERVHVHTCSLDHPAALGAYRRAGFTPYKRAVERFPDPRLHGFLPLDCAPQIPVLGTAASASARPAS